MIDRGFLDLLTSDEACFRLLHEDRDDYRRRLDEFLGIESRSRAHDAIAEAEPGVERVVVVDENRPADRPFEKTRQPRARGFVPLSLAEHPWADTVQNMDCLEGMSRLPAESVDCCVLSPPYDGLRTYEGNLKYDLHATGEHVFRLLKPGGICALVMQDQTKKCGKTLTTFKTFLDWCDNIGFKMFETVIYRKNGTEGAWWKKRFRVDHEYIALLLKGDRPAYFDKEPLKVPSKHGGKMMTGCGKRKTDGTTIPAKRTRINPTKCRGTVWNYLGAGDKDPIKWDHPAPFPDKIPYDVIQCFCPPGGLVIDPFMGSGSTAVAALKSGRRFIGFEIVQKYCSISERRIRQAEQAIVKGGAGGR